MIYRAEHRIEIERSFLAVTGCHTDLVHFLPLCHIISSDMHICSFTGTIFHMRGHAPKMVLHAKNLAYKKL